MIENWFKVAAIFCPSAMLFCFIIMFAAKYNFDTRRYHIETWHKIYLIETNTNKFINGPILVIEALNLLWGIIGSILNRIYIIRNCVNDYGIPATFMAFCFIFISYAHILRIILYLVCCIYHRKVFGWL